MVNSESENKYAKGARMASWKGQNLNLADIQPATQGLSVDNSNGTEVGYLGLISWLQQVQYAFN